MEILVRVLVLLIVAFQPISRAEDSETFTAWRFLTFDIPNITEGTFSRAIPVDFDLDHRGRAFITTRIITSDTPYSLSTYNNSGPEPTLYAYPDFSWHSNRTNCSNIIAVYRIAIDECKRIYVLDSGYAEYKSFCPPKLLVFNLTDDQLIRTYEFPYDQVGADSLLVTVVVDVLSKHSHCKNTMVYIADMQEYALIVYDYSENKSWRIKNEVFLPEPNFVRFTIAGDSFPFDYGIDGLSLSPKSGDSKATPNFHYRG